MKDGAHIKPAVLFFSFLLSIATWAYVVSIIPASTMQTIKLVQYFGFISIGFLFTALIPGPLPTSLPLIALGVSGAALFKRHTSS